MGIAVSELSFTMGAGAAQNPKTGTWEIVVGVSSPDLTPVLLTIAHANEVLRFIEAMRALDDDPLEHVAEFAEALRACVARAGELPEGVPPREFSN